LTSRGIQIESKEDIIARLKFSPDKCDSLIYSTADIGIAGISDSDFIFNGNAVINENSGGNNRGSDDEWSSGATEERGSVADTWGLGDYHEG
jgi:hypothetical protein